MVKQTLRKLQNNRIGLWIVLWACVSIVYAPAWKAGYQQDFEGWLEIYHQLPFWQLINRQFAAVVSFYQVTQLQLFLITKLFGTNPALWFLLFTGLHALNGTQLFRLSKRVFEDFSVPNGAAIALGGTFLVLFNPSMTEVVLWKAAYHYLIAVQGLLWMLIWTRQYLLTGHRTWIIRSIALLLLLAFTLEIWYTIPVMVLLMAMAYKKSGIIDAAQLKSAFRRLFIPQLCIFVLHLIAYRLTHGRWLAPCWRRRAACAFLFAIRLKEVQAEQQ